MARISQQRLYEELLDRYGRTIADAFLKAINDLRSSADLQRFVAAIAINDIEGAIAALHLDAAAFSALQEAIRSSFIAGGEGAVAALPVLKDLAGAVMIVRFDARNLAAEQWLKTRSSDLVTGLINDQKASIRQALEDGMRRGVAPRTVGLDIVGRINRVTGQREGGIIGLTSVQEQYARTAREELTSGDPALMRNYLTRTRRDKRYDRTITKAIAEGKPVPAETVSKAVGQYRNRLLALRGEMVGRTEALTSLNAGQYEAIRQAVESGKVDASAVRRSWRSASDRRVRHTHAVLHGETAGLEGAFMSPSGAMLRFPGDTSLGAPASEVVGCRCWVSNRIDSLANIR